MYYYDEDDDPYAPRIGPAAMPSPRSKFAPYYSGHANTFEDFLEEYEGLAYDCALTDPQRVDVLIRYVAPSLRDFWRSLSGYHSRDWPLFRQSLVNIFGSTTPRPQVMRQRLLNYVQDTSRTRMDCADDVIQYYREFLCLGEPLVHSGHLTEEDRNAAFWYGFHPEDREVLWPRLLGKNPFQPSDIPFHFEDVLSCARAAFAYDDYFPSPWSHAKQFEPPSLRREQPVVEPAPRDAYSFRAVTCAIASNAETTTTPDEFPPSLQSPDTQLPSSSSSSALESQHGLVHSVTLDQPETTYTLSTTLPPSDHPLSHTPALVHLTSDSDSIPAPTFPISTSKLLPSASPSPTHTNSLAPSAAADVPEIPCTHSRSSSTPLPPPTLAPFSMPISSDFEHLPSATVDQPAPTLSSMPPSSSPTSSTCLPSVTEEQPEFEPEPIPLIAPASTFASTPLTSSSPTFLPSPVISATDCQPATEPASTSTSESLVSKFGLSPRALSPPPGCLLVPPISSPTLSSLPLPEISTLDSTLAALSLDQPSSLLESLSQLSRPCELESSTPVSAADVVTLSHPELPLSSPGKPIPFLSSSLEVPPNAPISPHSTPPQRPPGIKTFNLDSSPLEVTLPPAFESPTPFVPQSQQPLQVYEVSSTLVAPRFSHTPTPRLQSGFSFARLTLTLSFVTIAALVSVLLNVSKIPSTHERKLSKIKDLGSNWKKTPSDFAHRLRLGQLTPRAARFVFDPGGSAFAADLGT
ncbi:hypothetical protein EDB89DRAFT_125211 [Lactarius sanguifluus]|nr:hypothetical protein EDB89DRAFT_125211 [Lactarius sanguifluus]